jgi:T5SS/PEP-CTERM-associated repeat protein
MYLDRIHAIIRYLFGRGRKLAECRVPKRVYLRCLLILAAMLSTRFVFASVAQTGSVTPADNPFTLNDYEGLPTSGNFVNPFEAPDHQTNFEGRHSDGVDPNNPLDDTNINFNGGTPPTGAPILTVGKKAFGSVTIKGGSALRDEDLVIGDRSPDPNNPNSFLVGSGVVRITEFGSLYNNNPNILPAEVDGISNFRSVNQRIDDDTNGFDLKVGLYGAGTLDISAGARAEIEDSVLIGDALSAVGHLNLDGFDSYMVSGGSKAASTTSGSDPHMMIVGRLGQGYVSITGGATLDTESKTGTGSNGAAAVGVSLGSTPYSFTPQATPDQGGSGTATVAGAGSTWLVSGTLQVGGFDIGTAASQDGDLEGDNTQYGNQIGHGTLYVNDGGLVNIRNAQGVDVLDTSTGLFLAIGRAGIVQLNGGTINIGAATGQNGQGQGQAKSDHAQVINDGTIRGSGYINTGGFRNRYLGLVHVDAGQTLTITAAARATTAPNVITPDPLSNYGLIEVMGTVDSRATLDFERTPEADGTKRPLINRPVFLPPNPNKFIGGMISAQWSTLRSSSGIRNEGILAFTAGQNVIQAHVDQVVGPTGFVPQLLIGPNTSVVVEDDCLGCAPTFTGFGNTLQILDPGTFTSAGTMNIGLSISNPNLISAAGDIGISGVINLTYADDVLSDLSANGPGRSYQIITFTGGAYQTTLDTNGVPLPDYSKPIPDCTGVQFCTVPGLGVTSPSLASLLGPSFNNVVPIAQRIGETIRVTFLNPGGGGAIPPDFNGDGVVNGADFAIWKANYGITAGASVLQGDADGDGDVDGADFLKWQRNFGHAAPWNGAGSGTGGFEPVPEPTSLALLLFGGAMAIAFGRRRCMR